MSQPVFFALVAIGLGAGLVLLYRRWKRRLVAGLDKVDQARKELDTALTERVAALEGLHTALVEAGYVPEGQTRLQEMVIALRRAEGPRAQAVADLDVEAVLHGIYRGLPRERIEAIRAVQNQLAQADEERDLARTRYNDLALSWVLLARRFPYRQIARRQGLVPPEPCLLPGEEADYARRHLVHP